MKTNFEMRPETIEDLTRNLRTLEHQKEEAIKLLTKEFDADIEALKKILDGCGKAAPQDIQNIPSDATDYSGITGVQEAVLKMLTDNRGKKFRAPDIARYLIKHGFKVASERSFGQVVRTAASRLEQMETSGISKSSESSLGGQRITYFMAE